MERENKGRRERWRERVRSEENRTKEGKKAEKKLGRK